MYGMLCALTVAGTLLLLATSVLVVDHAPIARLPLMVLSWRQRDVTGHNRHRGKEGQGGCGW
jgi:hypothetical protein